MSNDVRGRAVLTLVLVGAPACGATSPPASERPTIARTHGPPPGASNDNAPAGSLVPSGLDSGSVEPGRDVEGQILVSGPGFSPPVIVATGTAGGPMRGRDGPMGCVGYYPDGPQHVIKVGRRVPMLRIVADGIDRDLTLAVRTPDGRWHCNDDSGDPAYALNPAVDLSSAQGEIEVYVGTFSDDNVGSSYTLGVTEDPNRYGSSTRSDGAGPF